MNSPNQTPCACGRFVLYDGKEARQDGDTHVADRGKSCFRLEPQGVGGRLIRVRLNAVTREIPQPGKWTPDGSTR